MQTRICPTCNDDIFIGAKSHKCGWRLVAEKTIGRPVVHRLLPEEKAAYEGTVPRSTNLTEAQWAAVCKWWPSVAQRCDRGKLIERQPGEDDV